MELIIKLFYFVILLKLLRVNAAEFTSDLTQEQCGELAKTVYGIDGNEVLGCRYINIRYFYLTWPSYKLEIDGFADLQGNFSNPTIIGDEFLVRNSFYNGSAFNWSIDNQASKLNYFNSLYNYDDKTSLLIIFQSKLRVNGIINNSYMIRSLDDNQFSNLLSLHLLIELRNPVDTSLGNLFSRDEYRSKYSSLWYQKDTINLNIMVDNIYLQPAKIITMNTLIYWNAAIMMFMNNELNLRKPIREIKIDTIDILQSAQTSEALKIYENNLAHSGNLNLFLNEYLRSNSRMPSDFQIYMTRRELCFDDSQTKCKTKGYLLNLMWANQHNYTRPDTVILRHTSSFMNYPFAANKLFDLLDDRNYIRITMIIKKPLMDEIRPTKPSAIISIVVPKEELSYIDLRRRFNTTARISSTLLDKINEIANISGTSDSRGLSDHNNQSDSVNWQEIKDTIQEFFEITDSVSSGLPKKLNDTQLSKLNNTVTKMETYVDNLNRVISLADEFDTY